MNVLISVDMEGIAGVVRAPHISINNNDYGRFRKLATAETNAAIEGALAGGATRVVVNDSHADGDNILIEDLNPAAELISGTRKPFDMMQGIGPDVDAVFFIGYHGAAGTGAAVLEHTYRGAVIEARLNGQMVGEMGFGAALAGDYGVPSEWPFQKANGVPVVLATGDTATAEEARALLGEIETVAVKEVISRTAARNLHPDVACKMIRQAAERALNLRSPPFVVPPPITVRIVFQRAAHADMATMIPGSVRADGRTVEWTGDDMFTVYKTFRAMVALAYIE